MSLLGIDIGTTGCKSLVFTQNGKKISQSYREYDIISIKQGYAELDSIDVWNKIKETIKEVALQTESDPISALSVTSLGEAMVPVSKDREILGNSILGNDLRGEEWIRFFLSKISPEKLFQVNGNIPGVFYSMPKIAWFRKYHPELYKKTDYFLLWADLVCFLLGGKPVTNYSLASRTLLFDFNTCTWAKDFVEVMDLDMLKLAVPVNTGVHIGYVSKDICKELNLSGNVAIISGGHDQCCAALGSGIIEGNTAMYGMGTYICVVPAFSKLPELKSMFRNNLNIEHHVIPGLYVSFIYNISGGALVKWYRDTFASGLFNKGDEISYNQIFQELPDQINEIIVIPRFGPTGPPDFFSKHAGSISGLSFGHTRGDILRAMLEGMTFYFKDALSRINQQNISIDKLVANGKGALSKQWLQITSDILNRPIVKNEVSEAGALGAAIIAGVGSKVLNSYQEGIKKMVLIDDIIYPDIKNVSIYTRKYESYKALYNFF